MPCELQHCGPDGSLYIGVPIPCREYMIAIFEGVTIPLKTGLRYLSKMPTQSYAVIEKMDTVVRARIIHKRGCEGCGFQCCRNCPVPLAIDDGLNAVASDISVLKGAEQRWF